MDVRERMIRALAHKEGNLPDRVPIFVEGMMRRFIVKSQKEFGKELRIQDWLNYRKFGSKWKWSFYYKFDSCWLHSSPVRMNPLLKKIGIKRFDGKNTYLSRWGHLHQISRKPSTGLTFLVHHWLLEYEGIMAGMD